MAQEYIPPQEHIWINTSGPAAGMKSFRPGDLPELAQRRMDECRLNIRKENERYLAEHREVSSHQCCNRLFYLYVDALVEIFIAAVLHKKPKDFGLFAGLHFTRPIEEMENEIRLHLKLLGTPRGSIASNARFDEQISFEVEVSTNGELDRDGGIPLARGTSSFLTLSTSISTKQSSDQDEALDGAEGTMEVFLLELLTSQLTTGLLRLYSRQEQAYSDMHTISTSLVEEAMDASVASIRDAIDDLISIALLACERITLDASARRKFELKVARGLPEIVLAVDRPEGFVKKRTLKQTFDRYPKDEYGVYLSPAEESSEFSVASFTDEEIIFPIKAHFPSMSGDKRKRETSVLL